MRLPPGALALPLLAVALLWAIPARAEGPLGPGAPCELLDDPNSIDTVLAAMAFENGFAVEKGCEKLCKKARATCGKHVNRAVTCKRKSIDDSTYFQVQVTCAGDKGAALKECARPFEDDRKTDREDLEEQRDAALATCESKAQACAGQCGDAP